MSTGSWKDAVTRHLGLFALSSLLSFLEIVQKQFRTRVVFQEQRQYEESGPSAPRWFVPPSLHSKNESITIAESHSVMWLRHSAVSAKVQLLVHVHEQGPVTTKGLHPPSSTCENFWSEFAAESMSKRPACSSLPAIPWRLCRRTLNAGPDGYCNRCVTTWKLQIQPDTAQVGTLHIWARM